MEFRQLVACRRFEYLLKTKKKPDLLLLEIQIFNKGFDNPLM